MNKFRVRMAQTCSANVWVDVRLSFEGRRSKRVVPPRLFRVFETASGGFLEQTESVLDAPFVPGR